MLYPVMTPFWPERGGGDQTKIALVEVIDDATRLVGASEGTLQRNKYTYVVYIVSYYTYYLQAFGMLYLFLVQILLLQL